MHEGLEELPLYNATLLTGTMGILVLGITMHGARFPHRIGLRSE